MSDGDKMKSRKAIFDPTMCRNCSHERSAHAGCSDWDACLQCETCDQYVALGQKLADEMNAVEDAAVRGRRAK